jgi:peptidoglycan-associated lipoprotein
MLKLHYTILLSLFLIQVHAQSQKYVRKGGTAMIKGDISKAKTYYSLASTADSTSAEANKAMGLLSSMIMNNPGAALPFIERSMKYANGDTMPELILNAARAYQSRSRFKDAIAFYERALQFKVNDDAIAIKSYMQKQIQDCEYAMHHGSEPLFQKYFSVNLGRNVNSDMPEYRPVVFDNGRSILFNSQRKDKSKEKINTSDYHYVSNVYKTSLEPSGLMGYPRLVSFTKGNTTSKKLNNTPELIQVAGESRAILIKQKTTVDLKGNNLDSALLAMAPTNPFKENFQDAWISPDSNQLFFSSNSIGGHGGYDIFKIEKDALGQWGPIENLGNTINTAMDERFPFITSDGKSLFFSSNGYPGFGNMDFYVSQRNELNWSKPINLGATLNSPDDELGIVWNANQSVGYFASNRFNGAGDLDLYRIISKSDIPSECPTENLLALDLKLSDDNQQDFKNRINVTIPDFIRVLSVQWLVNDKPITPLQALPEDQLREAGFFHDYVMSGEYKVTFKLIAVCDTCLQPIVSCNSIINPFNTTMIQVSEEEVKKIDISKVESSIVVGGKEMMDLQFNSSPVYFNYSDATLLPEYKAVLDQNIEILRKNPKVKVKIYGFADSKGAKMFNIMLSQRRARSAADYMISKGVSRRQILGMEGKGSIYDDDICNGDANCIETVHKKNRKAIFEFITK